MNSQLLTYIRDARAVGMSNQDIVRDLMHAGWQMADIIDVLLSTQENTAFLSRDGSIAVEGVSKSFGDLKALDNVNLKVKSGTVLALLGPNGAGKTTLVRILSTLLLPDSGRAVVAGYDVVKDANELRSAIGLTGQFAAIDENLTGRENIEMFGRLYHLDKNYVKNRARDLLEIFDLTDAADRVAKTYSGGMKRRLDLASGLVGTPRVLFLDEPTTGLDPRSRVSLWRIIKELVAGGTTLLLTTQYLEEADHLADRIAVIDHGRLIAQGTSDELKSQVGGDVLEIHLKDHSKANFAVQTLRGLTKERLRIDPESGKISVPVEKGVSVLAEAIRLLDNAKIPLSDVVLRRPTLNDVFMALTGHAAEQESTV